MRQETYRFALDEATAELRDIVVEFEALRSRKEHIEQLVEALRPFIGLQSETAIATATAIETAPATIETSPVVEFTEPVLEQPSPSEPQYTFMQISGPGMEVTRTEPAPLEFQESEPVPEPVHALEEATEEQIAYFRQPSADPFQRRIDDALWGWQQRPEGLLSPI
jgi:hypothetical protein